MVMRFQSPPVYLQIQVNMSRKKAMQNEKGGVCVCVKKINL